MNSSRHLFFLLGALFLVPCAWAQYEIKAGNFNSIYAPFDASLGSPPSTPHPAAEPYGPPKADGLPPPESQFSAVGTVSGSSGPIDATPVDPSGPAPVYPAAASHTTIYPNSGASAADTVVLVHSAIGGMFASGLPRYSMGDEIPPPLVDAGGAPLSGATEADRLNNARHYWRAQPVAAGESLMLALPVTVLTSSESSAIVTVASVPESLVTGSLLLGGTVGSISGTTLTLSGNASQTIAAATQVTYQPPAAQVLFPLGSATVTEAATNSTTVKVAAVPAPVGLVAGAALLGQPVTKIVGTNPYTVTLAGNASTNISGASLEAITPATSYYYSPHSDKVYASQPGRVSVTWVTRAADGAGKRAIRSETFAVSSNISKPVRTIYWTEGGFDGPKVQITDSRITTVSPAYYYLVPKAVPEEVTIPGYTPVTPNLTTLSFQRFNGVGQLSAYNVEGRVFVEYLGNVRAVGNVHESLGSDVVNLVRVPATYYPTVHLGKEIIPHDQDPLLTPSPVPGGAQSAATYYGSAPRADGSSAYYAERETGAPKNPDDGEPTSTDAFNKVAFYWMEEAAFSIKWPKFQDRYWLRWSPNLADDYAHYTVDSGGSTPATGVAFTGGTLPQIVYQDDPAQEEARIDLPTQRLTVTFAAGADQRNRTLLKFSSGSKVWYLNLYTRAEERKTQLASTSGTANDRTLTVASTAALEAGMIVSGPGISGTATVTRILSSTQLEVSLSMADATNVPLTYTAPADIDTGATVGTRLPAPEGHENAGYISGGTGYYPAGYLNPFTVGVEAANLGAIIPVNALPTDNVLKVRWFKKISAPSADFQDLYVPGKWGRYTVSYPSTTTPQIVIAQGVGTGDLVGAQAAGSVYVQNDSALPGYNPNEEHALLLGGRAYALREDLNITSGGSYTSQPFVLLAYTENQPHDKRPAMRAYKVVRTDATFNFDYPATAGTLLVKPYPLPLMPQPMVGTGERRASKDKEVEESDLPANASVKRPYTKTEALPLDPDLAYKQFTFQDRKGFTWIHRGPHSTGSPTLTMKLYYMSQAGFFVPGAAPEEVAVDTVLPFLRKEDRSGKSLKLDAIDEGQLDEPLSIIYRPVWPAGAPELRVGETLTLPKFGLPQVRGQASAQVLYQQSIAKDDAPGATPDRKKSVTLHDPTREKSRALEDFFARKADLETVLKAIKTTSYQGRTFFQALPPHLQQRIFIDPMRDVNTTNEVAGVLVLTGVFHDEAAGEDYLDLNMLTNEEAKAVKKLYDVEPGALKTAWDNCVQTLVTGVETFIPDPARAGTYKVDTRVGGTKWVEAHELAVISSPNTAVDSYALTATGEGAGFVTMVFGNGNAFTPEGDPVQVQVFKVAEQLYVGDLKVVSSSNPLDEQVTLRHSGDFAGKPEDYQFEWRWATGAASVPQTYATDMTKRLGDATAGTHNWLLVSDPGALIASSAQYTAAGDAVSFTPARTVNVRPVNYVLDAQDRPTSTVIDATSYTAADIAADYPALCLKSTTGVNFSSGVPGSIIFSASLGSHDGFVLYVNGRAALAYKAPVPRFTLSSANTGLTANGLGRQFNVAPGYFSPGPNVIEVAIYTTADANAQSSLSFMLEAAQETDLVTTGSTWRNPGDPAGKNTNLALVGGSPANLFGGPQFVLNDRWFTMRYKTRTGKGNVLGDGVYSRWTPPQLVEGWIKRVLAAINPFEQRVKDLYNNQVNTDVSVLTQAGTRWEGDVALTLGNINDVGLIAIYETVLNRAKNMSIDASTYTDDPDTNNALLLAAGYLNDLYTILGNEAYADAANPTISLDDQTSVTEVNTSRFSFEGQVATSLDEELALLKGRDDSVSPGVNVAPAYNRLYWNYTRGINSGEAIYAVNYNIKEKVGSSTADGVIDEADAQRMFPQGHGDAYGHHLTALTGYYRLLTNANFTWTPRAEAVTVLGQPVTVDFQDERKFAAAAGNVARTAQQVVALVHRQSYKDDPAAGWQHYRDSRPENTATGVKSAQGLDEWASRSTQGALFHWVVANAMLPDVDSHHTGVQKIDRTTVPEIQELVAAVTTFQTTMDNANAHLNPLGLSPGAIAFDLSPTLLIPNAGNQGGKSHFEQIYDRSLSSLTNASGAFNQAAKMTRSLRNQQNQLDDYNTVLVQQERAYVNQLIDIYGSPYSGDVGPGRLYAQGYVGPDLFHWFIVDRPTDERGKSLIDTSRTIAIDTTEAADIATFTSDSIMNILDDNAHKDATRTMKVSVQPSQWVQYDDVWQSGGLGSRSVTGELQDALQDAQQTWLALSELDVAWKRETAQLTHLRSVFEDLVATHLKSQNETETKQAEILALERLVRDREIVAQTFSNLAEQSVIIGDAAAESFPFVMGLATDGTSAVRALTKFSGASFAFAYKNIALATSASARFQETRMLEKNQQLEFALQGIGFSHEEVQLAYEYDNLFRSSVSGANELTQLLLAHQRALQQVNNVIAKGNRILAEREVFRQRAAAIIQGYRTKDLGFRIFRNEALEQYRSLFDLASRYTYLAAKSYDYETGLLGTTQGQALFARIVASRSLGDLTGGVPQATTSTLGDAGLAGTMARLNADFSVAKGRLGINNPDHYGTVFSLRAEKFRIRTDDALAADDEAWGQTLEQHIMANVLTDADVAAYCRNIKKPNGSPVPGIVIPFSTTIQHAKNFFGLDYLPGDHNYTPSSHATKIYNVGIALPGYVGMDAYATGSINAGAPVTTGPNALGATPYVYFIPCGNDYMLAPPLGDTNTVRSWTVHDQALPLPFNLGASDFNSTQFFNANGTLSEQPWIIRKHQAFRMVSDAAFFYSSVPTEFTNSRLIGRSVWNGLWKIVIPAYTLHSNEQEGLNRFVASVRDIQLFLRTYSHSGN